VILAAPLVVAVVAAAPLALSSRIGALVAVLLVLVATAWVVLDMSVGIGKIVLAGARPRRRDRTLGGALRSYHWAISLCHSPDPDELGRLLDRTARQAGELTTELLPRDRAFGTVLVALRTASVTTPGARRRLARMPDLAKIDEDDWYVLKRPGPVVPPRTRAIRPPSGVRLMLATLAIGVVAQAQVIAATERAACEPETCGGRPVTFVRAFVWLLRHVVWQFPGPATARSHTLGVLTMVAVPLVAFCVVAATVRWIRFTSARRDLMYEGLAQSGPQGSSVLVLTVNNIERDAVVDAVTAFEPDADPRIHDEGGLAVFRLGKVGSADIVLAQSEQGTVSVSGMTLTAGALLRQLSPKPVAVILTGVCYGLDSREHDSGEQEIGDLVVATQLHLLDHRKISVGPSGERVEVVRGPRPEASGRLLRHARALTWRWTGAPVHFGPVVSKNVLLNNREERTELKRSNPEAKAGEMEAAGVYGAATQSGTDWIMVKGISDWGVDKSDSDQKSAARNAADFVVALVAQLAPAYVVDP